MASTNFRSGELRTSGGGMNLSEWLGKQPGGELLNGFLVSQIAAVGERFLVVGSVAEMASGKTDSGKLRRLQTYWGKREKDIYPFRKTGAIDVDAFFLCEDGEVLPNVGLKSDQIGQREMKNGDRMILVGEKVPPAGDDDYFKRRAYFSDTTWMELVPLNIHRESVVDQLQGMGYTQYMAVGGLVGEKRGLTVENLEGVKWIGREEMPRVERITDENISEVLGKDTKHLKMAVKSVVNCALSGEINKNREDLIALLSDRVALIREDMNNYANNTDRRWYRDTCMVGVDTMPMTANSAYLWINIMERMIDAWAIEGEKATELFQKSGLLKLMFGVGDEMKSGEIRAQIVSRLDIASESMDFATLVEGQRERAKAELDGLAELFSSPDLVI
jgi:hypothetical protein